MFHHDKFIEEGIREHTVPSLLVSCVDAVVGADVEAWAMAAVKSLVLLECLSIFDRDFEEGGRGLQMSNN